MPKKVHNIAVFVLLAYGLALFHAPLTFFLHAVDHLLEATDHHHDHFHLHEGSELVSQSHHHTSIALFESAFAEEDDPEKEDHENLRIILEKHLNVTLLSIQPVGMPICVSYGFVSFPLLSSHAQPSVPPPRFTLL